MKMTGAEIFVKALEDLGVDIVFGYPGGGVLNIYDGPVQNKRVGKDAWQEADIVGISRPCTKHNYLTKQKSIMARIIKEAFYIASTGRPGPVLVDIPKDVLTGTAEYHLPKEVKLRGYHPTYEGHQKQAENDTRLPPEQE